jgi:hypothetical protein
MKTNSIQAIIITDIFIALALKERRIKNYYDVNAT